MEIDERKLKNEEIKKIRDIVDASEKRPRKKHFTKQWVYDYLDESFKDFSYDDFNEILDMIDTLYDIGILVKVSKSRLKGDIIYHLVDEGFLEDKNVQRFNKLLNKWGIKKNTLDKAVKEAQEDDNL